MTFFNAYQFLLWHPAFCYKGTVGKDTKCAGFSKQLEIDVVMVNPKTNRIDDNQKLNTETRVWLECGPFKEPEGEFELGNAVWAEMGVPSHDYRLDCGGKTFEEAIIKLARLVKKYYGGYTKRQAAT